MAENLYYFDTQIWMDHYLKRGPNEIYGEQALALILKIIAEGSKVIFSNFNEKEIKKLPKNSVSQLEQALAYY